MSPKLQDPRVQITPTADPATLPVPQEVASQDSQSQDSESQDSEFKRARERAQALQGLYIHLLIYAVINTGLFLINWVTRGAEGAWWFYWPLLGWGVGVAIHVVTFAFPVFTPDWADRRAERMLGRREHRR